MFRRTALPIAACLAAGVLSASPGTASPTPCTVVGTTTWTAADSPHLIDPWDLCVSGTLTVEAGAEIVSEGGALIVFGQLLATGTPEEPISFSASGSSWRGIDLLGRKQVSELHHVSIRDADNALAVSGVPPVLDALTLDGNGVALRVANPIGPLLLEGSQLINNRTAVTGRSRDDVTITGNDFWNNRINLLAHPQRPWDCGQDAAVWSVAGNDILRGPKNDDYWSFDIRTPPGSRTSRYTVDVRDNWWGTAEETKVAARVSEESQCCPSQQRRPVLWKPVRAGPNTGWVPPGMVLDPAPEPESVGDPAWYSRIDKPGHGSCGHRSELRRLRGSTFAGLGELPSKLQLALRSKTPSGCRWWRPKKGRLVEGPCRQPRWFKAKGVKDWEYRFPTRLPAGRYTLISGGSDAFRIPALDLARFKLLR